MKGTKEIVHIVSCLQAGGVVALPTETIYGLCCDPRNEQALERLFAIKQRDPSKAALSVTGELRHIQHLVDIHVSFQKIADHFWPGPLTVVFSLREDTNLPSLITKDGTIALRLSPDPLIQQVTSQLDFPIIATSANLSGQPFLRSAQEVRAQFGSQLDLIIETDHELLQTPSTIIQCDPHGNISLIREGAIPWMEIKSYESQRG